LNGSESWNQRSAQTSAHNGWGGGQSLNAQQAQQQQMHADYSMSQYVAGLPGEIIEQVHGAALTNARCLTSFAHFESMQARIMDNIYMHLNVAWSVMNYSNIAYFAGELHRISTLLYQVRVCRGALACCFIRP
jgi:hypothetical protein